MLKKSEKMFSFSSYNTMYKREKKKTKVLT